MAHKAWIIGGGAVAIAAAAMVGAVALADTRTSESGSLEATPVAVETVRYVDRYEVRRVYAGRVSARREAAVGFDQGGLLAVVLGDEGDVVSRDALLAALDTRRLTAVRDQADGRVAAAEARFELSIKTLERQRDLARADNASLQRLDEAAAERRSAEADLQSAKADLAAAEAALELAQIRAPFDAWIVERFVDEGAVVQPGQAVLRLIETGPVELRVGLPPQSAAVLESDARLDVQVDDQAWPARLTHLVGEIDPATRTALAIFEIAPDDDGRTPEPGSVGRLAVARTINERGFWAPMSALAEGQRGLWSLLALEPTGDGAFVLKPRPVEVLHLEETRVYLRGAAQEGERFVRGGVDRVGPGQSVRPAARLSAERTSQ